MARIRFFVIVCEACYICGGGVRYSELESNESNDIEQ